MALNLKDIQKKLLEQQEAKDRVKNGGGFTNDNSIYAFWNNPKDSTTTIRFLPDGDETNDFFWREKLETKLPFKGVKGKADSKPCEVKVPNMDMWKPGSDPITAEIRPWWKDPSLEDLARKYYRKVSYIFQGFVVKSPVVEEKLPENPIRKLFINPSIFKIIKAGLLDQDLEHNLVDYVHGRDFFIIKTHNGKFDEYGTSKWRSVERALDSTELGAIEQYGLPKLNAQLPKKPDEEHLAAIMEMFAASVDGEEYDPERWGKYYRPFGVRVEGVTNDSDSDEDIVTTKVVVKTPTATPKVSTPVTQPKEVVETKVEKSDTPTVAKKQRSPEEILLDIRRRQQEAK